MIYVVIPTFSKTTQEKGFIQLPIVGLVVVSAVIGTFIYSKGVFIETGEIYSPVGSVLSSFSDNNSPERSNGKPTGTIPNTGTVDVVIDTNEPAVCKFNKTIGVSFENQQYTFTTTGEKHHIYTQTDLGNGKYYKYYIRCQDSDGNKNTNDYKISFTVDGKSTSTTTTNTDKTAPERSGGAPSGDIYNVSSNNVSINTNEPATCKFSKTIGVSYENQQYTFTTTGGKQHVYNPSEPIKNGYFKYYVRCKDSNGNANYNDYKISFTIHSTETQPSTDTTIPSAPSSLIASLKGTSQINLSWAASSDNIGVTGYNLHRNGTKIATLQSRTYVDYDISAGNTYSYTVYAFDSAGNISGASNLARVTISASTTPTPTPALTPTPKPTPTPTPTATPIPTPTFTPTPTPTPTVTPTATPTPMPTPPVPTPTPTTPPSGKVVKAFPTAEGFGIDSKGGRGGKVYEVTNLNDSGEGSFRNCVNASAQSSCTGSSSSQANCARTCVFKVGGLITLSSGLTITKPYITVAGQTAPGGGITLRKTSFSSGDTLAIATHDVIVRYLTHRPGPGGSNHGSQIASNGNAIYNIMIDHGTYSWGVDSNLETWYRVYNSTIQWSIISEGLDCSTHPKGCHSKGLMIGGYAGSEDGSTKGTENITIHHNLMSQNVDRNPLLQTCGISDVVNNVTYNAPSTFSHQQLNCPGYTSYTNWVGNYHKKGPSSTKNVDLKVIPADSGTMYDGKIYVSGNIGPSRLDNSLPNINWVESGSRGFVVDTPAKVPAVTTTDATDAYYKVLNDSGNNKGMNCDGAWYSRRDSIDTRIVNDVQNGKGSKINDPSDVGGWITPAAGSGCKDTDIDGMPDSWESRNGFNSNSAADGSADKDSDGYTNLEEFLNGTDPAI